MAAPVLQTEGALSVVTSGNLTPTLPAHQADDILVVAFGFWGPNSTGNPLAAVGAPSGWTQIAQFDAPALDGKIGFFWKRAASGSEANPTLTRPSGWDTGTDTAWGGRCYVIRGCATTGDPWDQAVASSVYSTANQAVAAVTVSGSERMAVHFLVKCDDFATAPTVSGWTAGTQVESTTGTDHSQGTFRKDNISASTSADASTVEAPAAGRYAFLGASFKPPDSVTTPVAATATLTLTPTVSASTVFARAAAAGLTLAPAVALANVFGRSAAATLTLAPAVSRTSTYASAVNVALTLTAGVAKLAGVSVPVGLSLSPVVTKLVGKTVSTTLALSAAVAVAYTAVRSVQASLALTATGAHALVTTAATKVRSGARDALNRLHRLGPDWLR